MPDLPFVTMTSPKTFLAFHMLAKSTGAVCNRTTCVLAAAATNSAGAMVGSHPNLHFENLRLIIIEREFLKLRA